MTNTAGGGATTTGGGTDTAAGTTSKYFLQLEQLYLPILYTVFVVLQYGHCTIIAVEYAWAETSLLTKSLSKHKNIPVNKNKINNFFIVYIPPYLLTIPVVWFFKS